MAMKKCKECGTEISSSAKVCPKCGKEQKNFFQKHIVITIILILVVFGMIGSAQINNVSKQEAVITSGDSTSDVSSESTPVSETNKNAPIEVNMGDTITGKDWEITLNEASFSQRVDPPEKNTFYNYYQVDDTDNTYLYVVLNCKNLSNLELNADSVATVKIKYNNSYTYSSFSAIPDKTLGFTYTSISKIKPLTTDSIYYLAEMPNSISTETDTPVEIEIDFENQKYICNYR